MANLRRTWYVNRMDKVPHSRTAVLLNTVPANTKQWPQPRAGWGLKDLGGLYYVSAKQCANWVKRDHRVESTDPWYLESDRDYTMGWHHGFRFILEHYWTRKLAFVMCLIVSMGTIKSHSQGVKIKIDKVTGLSRELCASQRRPNREA